MNMKKFTDKLIPALAVTAGAALTILALTAATPSNIPISGMTITTQAVEGAYIPLIQPWPGRATNDNFRIAKSNLFAGYAMTNSASIWTNDAGVYRPIDGTSINVTNLTSVKRLTVNGAFLLTGSSSTNLVTGTNGLNPYQIGVIQATGPTATPTDTYVSLSGGNGVGQLLFIENYTDGVGFCITNETPRWDSPTKLIRLNGDWCPITRGESILLRQDSHSDWVEVDRQLSATNYYDTTIITNVIVKGRLLIEGTNVSSVNPTIGRVPYNSDGTNFSDSVWSMTSDTNAIGFNSSSPFLRWITESSKYSLGMGDGALLSWTTASGGSENIAIGWNTMSNLTTGAGNTVVGSRAGKDMVGGNGNTALGAFSMLGVTNTDDNVAIGYQAGFGGTENTSVGAYSGYLLTGSANTMLGYAAGKVAVGVLQSTIVGSHAGYAMTAGIGNTLLGHDAGDTIGDGDYNTVLGWGGMSLGTAGEPHDNTIIGTAAYSRGTNSYNTVIGTSAFAVTKEGVENTIVGWKSGNTASQDYATLIGANAGYNAQDTNGYNTYVGYSAGSGNRKSGYNTFIGAKTGEQILDAVNERTNAIAIGYNVKPTNSNEIVIGNTSQSGLFVPNLAQAVGTQTFFGNHAGIGLTGGDNTAIGAETLTTAGALIENTAIGSHALNVSQANANTALGAYAMWKTTTGGANTAIGDASLGYTTIGANNTALGVNAGVGNVSGYGNIFIGAENHTSGNNALNNAILIGTSVVGTNDNEVIIGNATNTLTYFAGSAGIATVNSNRWIFKGVVEGATTNITINVNGKDYTFQAW